jgi:hypothetical protein
VLTLTVRSVTAWAPGIESDDEWRAWARDPRPIAALGVPDARFLPPLLRRRCTPLSKAMLQVAFAACPDAVRSQVRTVFASRHGENHESFPLFEMVVSGQPLSPMRFTHTVHNTQAALFSIAAGNRCAQSAIAGEGDTFGAGIQEALCHLEREPARPTLLVVGDVPVADFALDLTGEPPWSFALALLLAAQGEGRSVGYELSPRDPAEPPETRRAWPAALDFVRWWHGTEPRLELDGPRTRHRFTRLDAASAA